MRIDYNRGCELLLKRSEVLAIKDALSRHEAFNKEYLSKL